MNADGQMNRGTEETIWSERISSPAMIKYILDLWDLSFDIKTEGSNNTCHLRVTNKLYLSAWLVNLKLIKFWKIKELQLLNKYWVDFERKRHVRKTIDLDTASTYLLRTLTLQRKSRLYIHTMFYTSHDIYLLPLIKAKYQYQCIDICT